MLSLYLLTVVGLVVVAATDPHDFSRLCSSPAPGGECPAGWKNVGGDCVKFMSGWDQAKTKEVCKEEGAELTSFGLVGEACLVRRETQCQCGRTNRDREANIVGGGPAERNEYPWQVRLSSGCGGSIISRDKILTAAHCTEGHPVERITVFTRDHDRTREDGEVSHSVCSKREHPDYNREAKYDKDIAILTLCKPLMFTEAVGPICLPDPAQDYDNVKALLTGWGTLSYGGQHPDILQEVNVTTITNQQCRGKYSRITEYMICAGDVGRDSCQGDSGGPLSVLGQDDRYTQIGIVSWGNGCAKPGYPGVNTRLTSLLDWVNQPSHGPGILIVGGKSSYHSSYLSSAEVFQPGLACSVGDMPEGRSDTSLCHGLVCGGHSSASLRSCDKFEANGTFSPTAVTLLQKRRDHLCWGLPSGEVLLMGGHYSYTTTERVSSDGSSSSADFTLPYSTRKACGIDLGTSYVVTGGKDSKQRVTQYSLTGEVTELPDLINGRYYHACSQFVNTEGVTTLLVTGGYGGGYLSSTEIFTLDSGDWISSLFGLGTGYWMEAASLPSPRGYFSGATIGNSFLFSEDTVLVTWTTFSSTRTAPGDPQGR